MAGFDSTAGWGLMTATSSDWWCARLSDAGAEEIYADNPNAILAAAFHPPVAATEVEGGYRVAGQRPLASNIHDADWLMLTALVMDGERPKMTRGAPEVIALFCQAPEAEIVDSWYRLGMRGTDSNDVAVNDVFVPRRRTFPLAPDFEPGGHYQYQGPLYRLPGMGEVAAVIPPVTLALARGAITELKELAQGKTPFGSARVLRERSATQVARAEAVLRSAGLLFYDTLCEAWERTQAGKPSTLEQKADLTLAGAHAVRSTVKVVDLIYSLAGTSAIYTRSRLERHFRDVHTLRHHGFTAESRYETAGQVYLGVAPEFRLVAF